MKCYVLNMKRWKTLGLVLVRDILILDFKLNNNNIWQEFLGLESMIMIEQTKFVIKIFIRPKR